MEAICSSETSVATQQTTRRHIPEDDTLHNHGCGNLKSYIPSTGSGPVQSTNPVHRFPLHVQHTAPPSDANLLCLLQMLKSCRKLSMTVKSPNLHLQPPPDRPSSHQGGPWILRQTYSWMDRQGRPVSPPLEYAQATPPVVVAAPPPPPAPRYDSRSNKEKGATRKVRVKHELYRCYKLWYQFSGMFLFTMGTSGLIHNGHKSGLSASLFKFCAFPCLLIFLCPTVPLFPSLCLSLVYFCL
jgi:hypothetical protein